MELRDFLAYLAEGLLIVALSVVIAAAVQHYRVMTQRLREGQHAASWEAIEQAVKLAASIVKQTGLIEGYGPELRRRAIQYAQDFLDERGIKIDIERLATLIEAELATQIRNPSLPANTAQARQALLAGAIQAAVLAAEQSGMKGLIQNVAVEKKNYAIQLARRYLREHSINVDDEMLSGLIEAELLRLFLAARKQLPSTPASVTPEWDGQ